MLSCNYIQKGLLLAPPPFTTARLVDHVASALADALAVYYPVAGRLVTETHRDSEGLPLFAAQVTERVFLGFACNHALVDGTAFWNLVNAWAEIARARLGAADEVQHVLKSPVFERWSPDGCGRAPVRRPVGARRADAAFLGGVHGIAQGTGASGATPLAQPP
ncbi:hypothetical protein PR202_gb23852 [Eleusine coracana subsp. coracana]|uniref:Uncharacterized protein n=1 Tax=Eleusine coracana subsp. coracana TaxID=191504 RepID=A0AAV5FHB6_ELECO|nr:hypothetical protein PR202_gb23852 [Eleusine coracana subsp. coracana]